MKKILLIFLLPILFACNHSSKQINTEGSTQDLILSDIPPSPKLPQQNEDEEMKKGVLSDTSISAKSSTLNTLNHDWDKKIIKTAYLKFEVKNFKTYADVVHKAARQYGGYVANEQQNETEDKIESTISIKVPVDQFESIMNDLPGGASKIIEKRITTDDVTGEVIDTKSRFEAKRQMRLKYLEFLTQSKNMEDVLKVQREINDIQEEMEAASGRINYLSHQSAFSTINLTFYQPLPGYVPVDKTPGFSFRVIDAFKTGLIFITEIFIGIISIWPLFLIALIVWILYKRRNITLTPSKQRL